MSVISMKYLSLSLLTLHCAAFVISVRYSRVRLVKEMFIPSTVVLCTEVCKLFFSCFILLILNGGFGNFLRCIRTNIIEQPLDTAKICIPSLVYLLQNHLIYLAATHLSGAIFHITYQFKMLTTALFSLLLLNKKLSCTQWTSLILLMIGITIIDPNASMASTTNNVDNNNVVLGMSAALGAALCSGFAGVYFEKLLKSKPNSQRSSSSNLWISNIQLSFCSIPLGLFMVLANDYEQVVVQKGFFHACDAYVIYLILLNTLGGFLVGCVVQYADNILKGFATGLAILISSFVSAVVMRDFIPTVQFGLAFIAIISSIFLYNYDSAAKIKTN